MVRFKISLASHGYWIKPMFVNDRDLIKEFNKRLSAYDMRYDKKRRCKIRILVNTYATYHAKTGTYGLHRNTLEDMMEFLFQRGVKSSDMEMEILETYEPEPSGIQLAAGVEPRDYQPDIIDFLCKPNPTQVLPLQTGKGKAQPLDAAIKTPTGWTTMGQVLVGQTLIGSKGQPITVTGVYPQGERPLVCITFSDGRQTECCREHLWQVYRNGSDTPEILDTQALMDLNQYQWSIDLIELGEGHMPRYCALEPYKAGTRFRCCLEDTETYLNGSDMQRLEFLRGIMDADGDLDDEGRISYSTPDETRAYHLQYLVRSLGGKAMMFKLKDEYRLAIEFADNAICFTQPAHKLQARVTKRSMRLPIVSITPVGNKPVQCISVDAPDSLYVTDDFILTHNTFCALYTIAKLGVRTAVVLAAREIDTWLKDAGWIYEQGGEGSLLVVNGSKGIKSLIERAQKGEMLEDVLIFTVNILRDYLKEFEQTGESTYGVEPRRFYETLGVGLRITDEAHENLHWHMKHDIETHVPRAIYLSATIKSHDPLINQMYEIIYPLTRRYAGLAWDRYIDAYALGYSLEHPNKVKYKGYGGRYSHIVFEEYIMDDPVRERNYYELVLNVVKRFFLEEYQEGQKMLVFASSTQMCARMANYLSTRVGPRSVTDYTGEHESEVLYGSDIVCTTLGSAGTGKDIKGLVVTLLTTALNAREKNIQVIGRLRDPKDLYPGVVPKFYYLVCLDIDKHLHYHTSKVELMRGIVKSMKTLRTSIYV